MRSMRSGLNRLVQHPAVVRMTFFVFEEEQDSGSFGPDREVMEYLKSGSEMGVLDNFPRIKNLSLKYNTAPASSAPVERLFSLGSLCSHSEEEQVRRQAL